MRSVIAGDFRQKMCNGFLEYFFISQIVAIECFRKNVLLGGYRKKLLLRDLTFLLVQLGIFLFFIHLNVKTSVISYNKWPVWPKIKTFLVIDFSEPKVGR